MADATLDSGIAYWAPSSMEHITYYYDPYVNNYFACYDGELPSWLDGTDNTPPMATPESDDTTPRGSRKRRAEEGYYEDRERPRQRTTQENFMPIRGISNSGQHHSATESGTQHNPVEIESSPEQRSGERACITPSITYHYSASLRGYIHEADPTARWPVYYAVARGKVPGLYREWSLAKDQIHKFSGGLQKKFKNQEDAWTFVNANREHVERVPWDSNETTAGSSGTQPTQHEHMANQLLPSSTSVSDIDAYTCATPTPSMMSYFGSEEDASKEFFRELQRQESVEDSQSYPIPVRDFVPEPEPELSAQQKYVVDLIVEGEKNVFYTGSAGCGKSTILKAFVSKLKAKGKRVRIIAPTNLAALNVNGQTTWAFAGWTPDSMKKPLDALKAAAHGKEIWNRFNSTDVLVIDEISMVENLQFERLNEIMKASMGAKRTGPFGGTQIIVTGDFCQLSPVKPFTYCMGCGWELIHEEKDQQLQHRCENKACRYDMWLDTDKWAFRSQAWAECKFEHVNLTEIFRQSDKKFISILQKIRRDGVIVSNHARVLLNHKSETENAIKIYSLRHHVDRINLENIRRLPSTSRIYKCLDHFDWKDHHKNDPSLSKYMMPATNGSKALHQLKEHRYEAYLELKEGMRVVLQANLDTILGLVNGAQGTIIGFEPYDKKKLPRKASHKPSLDPDVNDYLRGPYAQYIQNQIFYFAKENDHQWWPIVEFDNGRRRTIYPDCSYSELGNEEKRKEEQAHQTVQEPSLLSRTQIPLIAGYAITVHKSQGMTLDRVIVDLSDAFESSQIYVALSRARSLQGLKVLGLPKKDLGGANKQVKEFFETCLDREVPLGAETLPTSQVLPSSQVASSSQVAPS